MILGEQPRGVCACEGQTRTSSYVRQQTSSERPELAIAVFDRKKPVH